MRRVQTRHCHRQADSPFQLGAKSSQLDLDLHGDGVGDERDRGNRHTASAASTNVSGVFPVVKASPRVSGAPAEVCGHSTRRLTWACLVITRFICGMPEWAGGDRDASIRHGVSAG